MSYAAAIVPPTEYANRTLHDVMKTDSWEGDKPAVIHRAVWRGLIKRLAQLEKEGIKNGELDASQISIYQNSKVTILNEPKENYLTKPTFKEQIKLLIEKAFEVQAQSGNLEWMDFQAQIQNDDIRFGELEGHPFLLSYEQRAYFLLEAVAKLKNKYVDWKSVYNDEVKDYNSIIEKVDGKKGYSDVFKFAGNGNYDDTAAGALWYSRHVVAHIEEYFEETPPPSKGEVGKTLGEFFPKMMLGLYKFMVKNEIDTGSEPRKIDMEKYISRATWTSSVNVVKDVKSGLGKACASAMEEDGGSDKEGWTTVTSKRRRKRDKKGGLGAGLEKIGKS